MHQKAACQSPSRSKVLSSSWEVLSALKPMGDEGIQHLDQALKSAMSAKILQEKWLNTISLPTHSESPEFPFLIRIQGV